MYVCVHLWSKVRDHPVQLFRKYARDISRIHFSAENLILDEVLGNREYFSATPGIEKRVENVGKATAFVFKMVTLLIWN